MEDKHIDYDDINNFQIQDYKYLYFDIFCRNNELVMICPVYDVNFDESLINVFFSGKALKLKKSIKKIKYEPIVVLIYYLISENKHVTIEVIFNNIKKIHVLYNLIHIKQTFFLGQTTLFKFNYKYINIWYDYYKNQGVDMFYLYYNGNMNNNIDEYQSYDKKIIEWDYVYWLDENIHPFIHHAQLGQMHHALYKYGKIYTHYMIFNDLDEYMYIPYTNLKYYIKLYDKYYYFIFPNYWSNNCINENITDGLIINISNKVLYRSKFIIKTSECILLNIHSPENIENNYVHVVEDGYMIHFGRMSNKVRYFNCKNKLIFEF